MGARIREDNGRGRGSNGMRAKPQSFVHRRAVVWLLGLMCAFLLSGCGDGSSMATPQHSMDESTSVDCDESFHRRERDLHSGSPPPWAPISSISSWREVNEAELLYELWNGADVKATDRDGRTMLHWVAKCSVRTGVFNLLLKHRAEINARMISGETPLMVAIYSNNTPEVIEFLLDNGADIEVTEHHGGSPLIRAGWHKNSAVVTLLLEHGADVRARDEYDMTILHTAMALHGPDVVEMLIERGADIHAKSDFGTTPLHRAAFNSENPRVVELLMDLGAEVNARANNGDTPLHRAARSNIKAVVKMLLDRGADVNTRGGLGYTPLHKAASRNQDPAVVELLLGHGSDINAKSSLGFTPLHEAANNNRNPVVFELLLERGADPYIENNAGQTACQVLMVRFDYNC